MNVDWILLYVFYERINIFNLYQLSSMTFSSQIANGFIHLAMNQLEMSTQNKHGQLTIECIKMRKEWNKQWFHRSTEFNVINSISRLWQIMFNF